MTTADVIRCPYCGAELPADTTICPGCHEDLSALVKLRYAHAIHYNEALALAREGKPEQAVARVQLALAARADFAPALVLLAKLQARQARWNEALGAVRRAAELLPEDGKIRALAQDIEQAAQRAERRSPATSQPSSGAGHSRAEQQVTKHEHEVRRAFGMGALAMALFALLLRWIAGRKRNKE